MAAPDHEAGQHAMSINFARQLVHLGEIRRAACPDCGRQRTEQEAYSLGDEGVTLMAVLVGALGACPCGAAWICQLCPQRLPLDGSSAWAHVKDEHHD